MKNMKDELAFLYANECQRFLQTAIIILVVRRQACPSHPE